MELFQGSVFDDSHEFDESGKDFTLPFEIGKEERDQLRQLRLEVRKDIESLCEEEKVRDVIGELRLLRFLRGKGSVQAAAKQYRQMLCWRKQTG